MIEINFHIIIYAKKFYDFSYYYDKFSSLLILLEVSPLHPHLFLLHHHQIIIATVKFLFFILNSLEFFIIEEAFRCFKINYNFILI